MDETAVSYQAAVPGSPVLSASGQRIGELGHVLQVPELDLFDGIVVHTHHGLRFIDADQVGEITRSYLKTRISDAQSARLPAPSGAPVYHVADLDVTGDLLHKRLGLMFGRPHWKRDQTSG